VILHGQILTMGRADEVADQAIAIQAAFERPVEFRTAEANLLYSEDDEDDST
jgi:hypothetical protein